MSTKKDNWSTEAYSAAASFVPKLTSTVISYLAVRPADRILDIGCGDGPLTAQIAAAAPSGHVLGLDASPAMIAAARRRHAGANCAFQVQDCTRLGMWREAAGAGAGADGAWDKVFSNAALHWILREGATRVDVFRDVYAVLKPGGRFVFEMGGKGNVGEVHAAILSALVHHGVAIEKAREASPWFFPSDDWMRRALTEVGFEAEKVEIEYRPTKCTPKSADGTGGLEGWVRLMGAEMLAAVDESKRDSVVKMSCDTLENIVTREEDGSQWIGYVRLRASARKPA
ncbi:hypothetical protein MBLNU459_g4863t1 [Dothideomycetes sp. NU459]